MPLMPNADQIARLKNKYDHEIVSPTERAAVDESKMETWAGGAKRSSKMPDWHMSPWKAWRGMLTRFTIGMKYGINNWKKTLSVLRAEWHDGEPGPGLGAEDKSALGFVRQFYAHGQEHFFQAVDLADKPVEARSPKGDSLIENLYAYLWNAAALVEYAIENEDMFREAFSQYPEGSPNRRMDLDVYSGVANVANVANQVKVFNQILKEVRKGNSSSGELNGNLGSRPAAVNKRLNKDGGFKP